MTGNSAHRPPAVAGAFYPAGPQRLRDLVAFQLAEAGRRFATPAPTPPSARLHSGAPIGVLVPHAGLEYSGVVAATAWRLLAPGPTGTPPGAPTGTPPGALTIVLLGTNHRAIWLDGIAAWDRGSWHTPIGDVAVDEGLTGQIVALGSPFLVDREAHFDEHSIEVQLPFLAAVAPEARIVPLAVATGLGADAVAAGERLGALLATHRRDGVGIVLAISTDMAHYPPADEAAAITDALEPSIVGLDPVGLAGREQALRERGAFGRRVPGLACGMCGIEPAVVGLAALRAMGARGGTGLASATSADVGGPRDRTVGYLAVRFD